MRIKLFLTTVLMFCLFSLYFQDVFAQEQNPSLSETVNWLQGKTDYIYNVRDLTKMVLPKKREPSGWKLESSGRCALVLKNTTSNQKVDPQYSITFSLADFSPEKIEIIEDTRGKGSWSINLYTKNKKRAVNWQVTSQYEGYDNGDIRKGPDTKTYTRTDSSNNLSLVLDDKEMAQRIAKALDHAIKLCGGGKDQKEPF